MPLLIIIIVYVCVCTSSVIVVDLVSAMDKKAYALSRENYACFMAHGMYKKLHTSLLLQLSC